MEYSIEYKDGVTIVNPSIDCLDASNSAEFKELLTRLHKQGADNIDLNVSQLKSIDSSGLLATTAVFSFISQRGRMTISGAHGVVAKIIKMTKLNRLIEVSMDPQAAHSGN